MPSTGAELLDGLAMMAVGMAVVFAVLVVLMGIIGALSRWFPGEGVEGATAPPEPTAPAIAEAERGIVAAISVALARMMAGGPRRGGAAASQAPRGDSWRLFGRRQLMESRQEVKGRRSASSIQTTLRRWRSLGGKG